jgi:hypothetical protein
VAGLNRFDVAVVSYNTDFYLYNLLVSIGDVLSSDQLGDVHVWDNASSDATVQMLAALKAEMPRLRVHASGVNLHHGPALDRLLRTCCTADWVLVLDPDTEVRRNFVASLPRPNSSPLAFIGQIHPQASHLYASLAHLLIHRPTYLSLPPFCHDGAPGRDFFRAIETRQMPYARFRWCDYVSHAGQASLRGVHARRETANPFYAFAASVADASPASADRLAREAALRSRLAAFLDTRAARETTPSYVGRALSGPPLAGPNKVRPTCARRRTWTARSRVERAPPRAMRNPPARRAGRRCGRVPPAATLSSPPTRRRVFRPIP